MKVIAYSRPDGGVSICTPAPQRIAELMADGMTEAAAIAVIQAKDVPADASNIEVMDGTLIPSTRQFRDAWTKPAVGAPVVDMPKARIMHMDRIRQARNQKLTGLDIDYQIADDNDNAPKKAAVTQERRELRDLPANTDLDQFSTPETLDAFWPTELPARA